MALIFFSRSDPFEVAFFRIVKWILDCVGIWPLYPLNRSVVIKLFINMSILLTVIVGGIRYTWLIRRHPTEMLAAICPYLTEMPTWIKMLYFIIYRQEIAKLLNDLFMHLNSDTKDFENKALIGRVSFFTIVWSIWLYFVGIATNFSFCVAPLLAWTYQNYVNGVNTRISLPFQVALPYEDMTQLHNNILYSLMYCFLAYSGNITIHGFPGVDGAYICFSMYISAAYQCLQNDFKRAFKRHTSTGLKCETNHLLYNELCLLVLRQQNITIIFNRFNRIYKYIIFAHFSFAGIVLGVSSFDLLLTTGASKCVYVAYVIGVSTQLFTYCYGSEYMNESCIKLAEVLYFCDWYKCDPRVRKLILLVMMKSQRGSLLKAPFFTPSIPLFAAITKTSGSYITLLKTFI